MSTSHIILDNLPSLCQKLSDLVGVWRSYNKNNFACFFETRCRRATALCSRDSHWGFHGNGNWWHNWEWEWEGMGITLYGNRNGPYSHGTEFPSADALMQCLAYVIVTHSLLYNGNSQ